MFKVYFFNGTLRLYEVPKSYGVPQLEIFMMLKAILLLLSLAPCELAKANTHQFSAACEQLGKSSMSRFEYDSNEELMRLKNSFL